MNTDTQQTIIIGLVLIALAFIVQKEYTYAGLIGTGLLGFVAPKTLTDKQSEVLNQQLEKQQVEQ
jgi:hypothetical protein